MVVLRDKASLFVSTVGFELVRVMAECPVTSASKSRAAQNHRPAGFNSFGAN